MPQDRSRTKLTPQQETDFQRWYSEQAVKFDLSPNPDDPEHKYDYRGAYLAGQGPDNTGHWPSRFKDSDHPRRFLMLNGKMTDTTKDTEDSSMADNTRPRYVNPPMDFSQPPVTPPFVQQGDPYEALQQVLSNLNPVIAPPPQGKFQQIMNLIANAAVVGTAQDPSAALANQLAEKRKQDLFYQQANIARQNKLEDVGINVGLQKAQDLTQQLREARNFDREARFRTSEREATQKFNADEERQKEIRQFNIDSIKRDWPIEDQEKAFRIKKRLEKEYLPQDLARETEFVNLKNADERRAAVATKTKELQLAGIGYDVASSIARKAVYGEPLTPSESKIQDRAGKFFKGRVDQEFASKMEENAAQAYHARKSGDAAVIRAGLEKAQFDKMDRDFDAGTMRDINGTDFVKMKDGSFIEYGGFAKKYNTLPPGAERLATPEENIAQRVRLAEGYMKDAAARKAARGAASPTPSPSPGGSPTPSPTAIPTPNPSPGQTKPTELETLRMQIGNEVEKQINSGRPPAEVNAMLDQMIQKYPQYAQMYEGFKIRTAANPTAQASPTPSPTPTGTSVEDYQKQRKAQQFKSTQFGAGAGPQIRKISPEEKAILDEVEKRRKEFEKTRAEYNKLHGNP